MSELTKALVAAKKMVSPTVYKAGRNEAQRYAYVGHEHVVSHARAAMIANGLSLEQVSVSFDRELTYQTRNGAQVSWLWIGEYALHHTSGESRSYRCVATTAANDKAGYVASTALDRTIMLRLMALAGSLEEDPEHDSHEPDPSNERRHTATVTMQEHVDEHLVKCTDKSSLVQWARDLLRMPGDKAAKAAAWEAFAAQCAIVGVAPSDVAKEAKS